MLLYLFAVYAACKQVYFFSFCRRSLHFDGDLSHWFTLRMRNIPVPRVDFDFGIHLFCQRLCIVHISHNLTDRFQMAISIHILIILNILIMVCQSVVYFCSCSCTCSCRAWTAVNRHYWIWMKYIEKMCICMHRMHIAWNCSVFVPLESGKKLEYIHTLHILSSIHYTDTIHRATDMQTRLNIKCLRWYLKFQVSLHTQKKATLHQHLDIVGFGKFTLDLNFLGLHVCYVELNPPLELI